jgi:hypothetical protein
MLRRRIGRSQTATPECGMDNTAVFGPVRIFQHRAKTALRDVSHRGRSWAPRLRRVLHPGVGAGHLASGSTSHVGARRGHPAGARSHILADTTATSVGTSVAPTPAMTVDRAKLQQLPEQLDVLLASANRR